MSDKIVKRSLFMSGTQYRDASQFGRAFKVKVSANGKTETMTPLSKNDTAELAIKYPGLTGDALAKAMDQDERQAAREWIASIQEAMDQGVPLVLKRGSLGKTKDGRMRVGNMLEESKLEDKETLSRVARAIGTSVEELKAKVQAYTDVQSSSKLLTPEEAIKAAQKAEQERLAAEEKAKQDAAKAAKGKK